MYSRNGRRAIRRNLPSSAVLPCFLRCEVSVVFFFVELSHFVSARFTVARLVAKTLQPSSEPSVKEEHEEWKQKAAG